MRHSAICVVGVFLGSILFGACRRDARVPPPSNPPVSAEPPASPKGAPLQLAQTLTPVMQKGLPLTGFRLDPEGKFAGAIAQSDAQKCDVWRLEEGAYAGQIPAAQCSSWPAHTFVDLYNDSSNKKAKPDSTLVKSPDGKLQARVQKTQLEVVDLATGRAIAKLPLRDHEELLPTTLRWVATGLIVLADSNNDSLLSQQSAYLFQGPPFGAPKVVLLGHVNLSSQSVLVDPRGRFLFVAQHIERVGDSLHVVDFAMGTATGAASMPALGTPSPLSWRPRESTGSEVMDEQSKFEPGRWQDATRPYFETLEKIISPDGDSNRTVTWRILAAPGDRRLLRIDPAADLNPALQPPSTMKGKAMTEPAASELKQRFTGVRMNTLRRVSDGEELTFTERGCANSKRGAYSCGLKILREQVFLLGPDPLSSPIIHGDQIAQLMYDPQLVEHFYDGAPLPPRAMPRLGAAPAVELRSVKYEAEPERVTIEMVARDGGDGVSEARIIRTPTGKTTRLPLVSGKPSQVTIPIGSLGEGERCGDLRIYACNGLGAMCSRATRVPTCPQSDDSGKGQELEFEFEDE